MLDNDYILEHEILKSLYIHTSFNVAGKGTPDGKFIPLFKRDYSIATIHFGTLVDIVNNPDKYSENKSVQSIIIKYEDVNDNIRKYKWIDVSNAIELLELNAQVIDEPKLNEYGQCIERKISLTKKGAIDYRKKYYSKQSESEKIEEIKNAVTRIEHKLKLHWLRNEIIKYTVTTIVGAILGAIIALISSQSGQKSAKQLDKQLMITADTIILK